MEQVGLEDVGSAIAWGTERYEGNLSHLLSTRLRKPRYLSAIRNSSNDVCIRLTVSAVLIGRLCATF